HFRKKHDVRDLERFAETEGVVETVTIELLLVLILKKETTLGAHGVIVSRVDTNNAGLSGYGDPMDSRFWIAVAFHTHGIVSGHEPANRDWRCVNQAAIQKGRAARRPALDGEILGEKLKLGINLCDEAHDARGEHRIFHGNMRSKSSAFDTSSAG